MQGRSEVIVSADTGQQAVAFILITCLFATKHAEMVSRTRYHFLAGLFMFSVWLVTSHSS